MIPYNIARFVNLQTLGHSTNVKKRTVRKSRMEIFFYRQLRMCATKLNETVANRYHYESGFRHW